MAEISRKTIESSLKKKGFEQENGDHRFYNFIYEGKKTSIRTKISHGSHFKGYGDELLKAMKTQLGLSTLQDTRDLLTCPMDHDTYIQHLLRDKKLKP